MIADLFKGRCKWHIKLSIQVQISGRETTKKILKEGKNDDMNCLKYMHYKMTLRQTENQWSCVNCFFFFFWKGKMDGCNKLKWKIFKNGSLGTERRKQMLIILWLGLKHFSNVLESSQRQSFLRKVFLLWVNNVLA